MTRAKQQARLKVLDKRVSVIWKWYVQVKHEQMDLQNRLAQEKP